MNEKDKMTISKASFNKANSGSTNIDPDKLIKKINKALKKAKQNEQYKAIQSFVTGQSLRSLKEFFEIEEYITAHKMIWLLINAYNES